LPLQHPLQHGRHGTRSVVGKVLPGESGTHPHCRPTFGPFLCMQPPEGVSAPGGQKRGAGQRSRAACIVLSMRILLLRRLTCQVSGARSTTFLLPAGEGRSEMRLDARLPARVGGHDRQTLTPCCKLGGDLWGSMRPKRNVSEQGFGTAQGLLPCLVCSHDATSKPRSQVIASSYDVLS
jgi:hypothetical protein